MVGGNQGKRLLRGFNYTNYCHTLAAADSATAAAATSDLQGRSRFREEKRKKKIGMRIISERKETSTTKKFSDGPNFSDMLKISHHSSRSLELRLHSPVALRNSQDMYKT